jgi:hypothetical protein
MSWNFIKKNNLSETLSRIRRNNKPHIIARDAVLTANEEYDFEYPPDNWAI